MRSPGRGIPDAVIPNSMITRLSFAMQCNAIPVTPRIAIVQGDSIDLQGLESGAVHNVRRRRILYSSAELWNSWW